VLRRKGEVTVLVALTRQEAEEKHHVPPGA
jgi:hypothetical protein